MHFVTNMIFFSFFSVVDAYKIEYAGASNLYIRKVRLFVENSKLFLD